MGAEHIESTSDIMTRSTPLKATHLSLGAKMVDFAGYAMPLQYTSILEEHMAVRTSAGLFDVSHMGEIFAMGPNSESFVQQLVTNDISQLDQGQAQYTVMCNESGGVIDDLLVYKIHDEAYMMVVNAANLQKDYDWMKEHNPVNADLHDVSEQMGLLALQGPASLKIASKLIGNPIFDVKNYRFLKPETGEFMGFEKVIISRTGYTGDIGLEFYVESENTSLLWDAIMEAGSDEGILPAGLGSRDTLRIEAGLCLYGNELSETINPYEARLGWITKLEKSYFVGQDALRTIKSVGPERRLVGLVMNDRGIPRSGYPVVSLSGEPIGEVTSGSQSPILGCGIALAYIKNHSDYTSKGQELGVQVRSRILSCSVQPLPFYSGQRK